MQAQATKPTNIAVSKSKGIRIDWADGSHSEYDLTTLRDRCPCAGCTGSHGTPPREPPSPFHMYQAALRVEKVTPVGNYALQIHWNDGHNSGIYTWEYLRSLAG